MRQQTNHHDRKRRNQIQIKVTEEEKDSYGRAAQKYGLTLAAYARFAMEHVKRNMPDLVIAPTEAMNGHAVTHNNGN